MLAAPVNGRKTLANGISADRWGQKKDCIDFVIGIDLAGVNN
jgi:hypothetical protein